MATKPKLLYENDTITPSISPSITPVMTPNMSLLSTSKKKQKKRKVEFLNMDINEGYEEVKGTDRSHKPNLQTNA